MRECQTSAEEDRLRLSSFERPSGTNAGLPATILVPFGAGRQLAFAGAWDAALAVFRGCWFWLLSHSLVWRRA